LAGVSNACDIEDWLQTAFAARVIGEEALTGKMVAKALLRYQVLTPTPKGVARKCGCDESEKSQNPMHARQHIHHTFVAVGWII
jgi:hypothetical protein